MSNRTNAPSTVVTINLTGQADFNIPFEYLARKFIVVTLIGETRRILTLNTDYRFVSKTVISLVNPSPAGFNQLELRRETSATERLVGFYDGSILRATDLNLSQIQTLHVAEEARDIARISLGTDENGDLDARNRRIVNLKDGREGTQDAASMYQLGQYDSSTLNNRREAEAARDIAVEAARKASEVENSWDISNTMVWNRSVVVFGIGTRYAAYMEDGRMKLPRLQYLGNHYISERFPPVETGWSLQREPVVQPNGDLIIYTSATERRFLKVGSEAVNAGAIPFVLPEEFGEGAEGFERAADHCLVHGTTIKLSNMAYSLGGVVADLKGVSVDGPEGASVNGNFRNAGRLTGFKYGPTAVGQTLLTEPRNCQLPASGFDNKFVVQFANTDVHMVCTKNDGLSKYDTSIILRKGNGGDQAPWEHLRSQQVYRGVAYAFQGFDGATMGGTFTDFSATPAQAGFIGDWASTFAAYNMHFMAKRTEEPSAFISRSVDVSDDGYVTVGLFTSTSGSAFSIEVDNVEKFVGTTRVDVRKPRFRTVKIYVGFQQTAVVKVVHKGNAGQHVTVLGFNVHRPAETRPEITYDKFAMYFERGATYSANAGAHDYAMRNDAIGFFGSYHGGETALTAPVWRVDDSVVTLVPEKPVAGSVISLTEKTRLHGIVDVDCYQRFDGNSRHSLSVQLAGTGGVPFEVEKLYLGMNGTYDAFSKVLVPEIAEGVSGSAAPDYLLGMTNMVVQENPSTGQTVTTYCNMPTGLPSGKGGVFIKTLDEVGTNYQKVYFAWVYESPIKLDKVCAQIVKVFC